MQTNPIHPGPTRVRFLILMMACLTSWFLYLHRYTWNIVAAQLQAEYGFNNTQTGALYSFFSATYGFGQIPSGIVSDLIGPHFFLGIIIAGWSLVLCLFGVTGNYKALAGLQLLFGMFQSGAYPNLAKVTRTWFPARTRTIVQGLVASFSGRSGGAMSSIILATVLMGLCGLSWQASLIVMGAGGVLFGGLFLLLFCNSPDVDSRVNDAERKLIQADDPPVKETDAPVFPARRAAFNFNLHLFVFQQFLNAGADVVFLTSMGLFFTKAKGFEMATAGIWVSLPLWGGAIGGLVGGVCNDWLIAMVGRRWGRSIMGFVGKFLACILMFVAISQESGEAAAMALFVVKFFSDWSQPTVWGTCTDLGGRYSATLFGILNTSGTVGSLVCPPLFGIILDRSTVNGVTNFNPMFVTVAVMYVVCACCWLLIDCTRSLDRTD